MAANTGPDISTYAIPEVALGDTFNTWRDVTNTSIYKLNKMRVYDGVSSSSISMSVAGGGTLSAEIADNVGKGVSFMQPVVFQSGVTFNGDVTFNASTFTVNANIVTIDDYALILGNTASGSSDTKINQAGGGGLLIDRGGSGNTAEWLWLPQSIHGVTGMWQANAHIGISGSTFGIYPNGGGILPVHGSGIRLDGGSTTDHGFLIELTSTGAAGTTSNRAIQFERYSPSGATVFMEVLSGTTYGARPFVNISDGANRKTIFQSGHPFQFGQAVRFDGSAYQFAQANNGDNAEVVGIVSKILSGNEFEITFLGEIFGDFSGALTTGTVLIPGKTYYLAPDSAGKLTSTQPITAGQVHKAVMVSTGTNSAVVLPFTGGVLQSPIQISSSSSVSTRISQLNKFVPGDIVRFKSYSGPGVTLEYSLPSLGATASQYFSDGIYVKAQANTPEEAEMAGMVVAVGASGEVNASFDVLMDGFFNLSALPYGSALIPGSVYFLATNCAGTTGSFESLTSPLSTSPASLEGQVRKPLFMATSSLSGYLFSYRGDVRGAATGISFANLDFFLVNNISDGVSGDLRLGVFNGSQNGREVIRLAAGQSRFTNTVGITGNVGIGGGWSAINAAGNGERILSQLDVRGDVRVGVTLNSVATPQGRDLIISRYSTDNIGTHGLTAPTFNVIGTRWANSNLALGHCVRSGLSSDSWVSSNPITVAKSALVLGVSGSDPALVWKTAASSATALGGAVSLTDTFSIVGNTAAFVGAVNIGTTQDRASAQTHKPRLFIQGDSNTTPRPQVYMTTTDGNFLLMNASGSGGDYNGINAWNGGSYLLFGKAGAGGAGHTFAIAPWATGTQTVGMLMTYNGTSVNVGINKLNPAVALDVTGEARSSTSTTSSSNDKTLTTKDYVDYVSQTKIDEYLEYTNNTSGSFLQIPVSTFQVGKLYALKLKVTVSPGSGANFSIIGTPINTATAESSTTIPGEGIMVLATYTEFNSTNNVVSQSVGGPQFYGMVLQAIGVSNKPANVIANFAASCSNNNSTAVTWVLLRRLW